MTGFIAALLLPWILGISWLSLLGSRMNWQIVAGYGYVLGIVVTTLLIRGWDFFGLSLSFWNMAIFIAILAIIPLLLQRYLISPQDTRPILHTKLVIGWKKWLFVFLLSLLSIRYIGIFLEIIWLPLYPWDAWMNWAPKAKIWFELNELVPFVSPGHWLSGEQVGYTLGNREAWPYPPAIPLIQFWSALGLGEWRDDWINIPWLFCCVALGLGFYGQARLMNVAPHTALLFTYLLLSMPFINIHTLLAGYADIWLACSFGFSTMAFFNWVITRDRFQCLIMLLFALAGMLMKVPGIAWAAVLLPAVAVALIPKRWQLLTLSVAVSLVVVIMLFEGLHLNIPGFGPFIISLDQITLASFIDIDLEYKNISSAYVINNLVFENWHLFWYLLISGFLYLLITGKISEVPLPWVVLAVSSLAFLFIVFFMVPRYHNAAMNYVTLNRATLHIIPMLVYLIMLIWAAFWKESASAADVHAD